MLGEVTHLQAIVDDLTVLTEDPHKLPPASEQVTRAIFTKMSATVAKYLKDMWRLKVIELFNYSHCPVFPTACVKSLIR